MLQKVIISLLMIVSLVTLTGCDCAHEWQGATCTSPKTCALCGETEGVAVDHVYKEATCTTPKTCMVCKAEDGTALGHNYKAATCTEPKICEVCNETEGKPLGHSKTAATCTEPPVCTVCKVKLGRTLSHNFAKATYEAPKTCMTCGKTEGDVLKLSDSCDMVLASGTDRDGNIFELVANETENYSGTTIEIGVIKNNAWSVPLTTDSPFIGVDGLLYDAYPASSNATGSIYDEYYAIFRYIGNGCFYYENRIWNGDNGLSYMWKSDMHTPVVRITEYDWIVENDGKVILEKYDNNYCVLDTTTMQVTELDLKPSLLTGIDYCAPHSEGLFACMNRDFDKETNGFYDLDGNKVIDLSCYIMAYDSHDHYGNGTYYGPIQKLVFENGTCTFKISNDQGTEYYITIDKTGTVIQSKEA